MPRTPIDYSKTLIYKLEHNVDKSLVYVGSTTDFKSRKREHKSVCKNEKSNRYNLKVYKMIRENGGWDSFQMLEIKKYPCKDSNEARAEEEHCRIELQATLNTVRAFRSKEQKKEQKKEQDKKYREVNKDKAKEESKKYREANKDKIKEYQKEYRKKRATQSTAIAVP